jgi:predicted ATP-dependent endonuclease of OLD family
VKVNSIKIKHFRGIKDSKISLNNLCCLVGENNSGKSTVLRALNAVFNYNEEVQYFLSGQHLYSKQSNPQIQITFSSANPPTDLSHLFNGNTLKLTFIFQRTKSQPSYKAKVGVKTVDVTGADLDTLKKHISFVLIEDVPYPISV